MEPQGVCVRRYAKTGFRSPAGTDPGKAAFEPKPFCGGMRVFLTGGSGFVGRYVLDALLGRGHSVRCLVRTEPSGRRNSVEYVRGDVTRPEALKGLLDGCEAVIHLVGIIEEDRRRGITFEALHTEATRNVIAEAQRAGVDRFLLMSANGARQRGVSRYQTTKWDAEQLLRSAGFGHWSILRPSLVFGDPGPDCLDFCTRLARDLVGPFPVLPVFGKGDYQMQPVSVQEVAAAFEQALTLEAARFRTYCVAGERRLRYTEILDTICVALGMRPKPKVLGPRWLIRPLVGTLGGTKLLPVSIDQFDMLLEGNTCDESAFHSDFDIPSRVFEPASLAYVKARA